MNLIKLSISRPVLVAMLMLALGGVGAFCYMQLPRELFPEVEFPFVTVSTIYEGAGPEEVEQLISKELEDEISTIEGIKHLTSISQQGLSLVMIEFELKMNIDVAAADVRDKVNLVRAILPEEAEEPIVQKFDIGAQPVVQLAVSAPRPLREVFHIAEERIKDRLSTIPDVASVKLIGGQEREIHILVNQQRLRSYGLSITSIFQAIAGANLEMPGGHISQNTREYNIRLQGKFTDLNQIRDLRILLPGQMGRSIYLRDVAQVIDTYKEVREKARANGNVCVGLTIQRRSGGNTVAVVENVKKVIVKLDEMLPDDYEFSIQNESASIITASIQNVLQNMIIGIILTAVTLFIFLHTFRSVLIISLTMPISVLATFMIMYSMGFTLNMMSLMGLAMTVGVLVNNAILVLENITRYLHLDHPPNKAADEGTSEIAVAVASTTMTNIVVFVPIAFMGGIVGQFFKDFGLTATFATIVSLLISFTLAPMLASKLLTKKNTSPLGNSLIARMGQRFDRGFNGLRESYAHALKWCLAHRSIILVNVFIMLFGAFKLTGFIGGEFITPSDEGKLTVIIEMPVGTRMEETDQAAFQVEEVISQIPELVNIFTQVGRVAGNIGGASKGVNLAQIWVTLTGKSKRTDSTAEIIDRLRPMIAAANIPAARIKLLELGPGHRGEATIQLDITGDDLSRLDELSKKIMDIISDPQKVPGVLDVDTNYRLGQPEIRIIPDRDKCRDNNVDSRFLSQVVAATFEGIIVSEYRDGAYNYDIRVKASEDSRRVLTDIGDLTIMNQQGNLIPLPEVASIDYSTGPSRIFRKDRQSLITISCENSGRSPGEVVADIQKQIAPILQQYPNCNVFYGGSIERMQESFSRLFTALIMAVSLTYMLLASLLESFTQPLIIMFSLPLSLIGVFIALFLMGGTFSIFSIMSIIMLVGLVINNSIIVIDYINTLRKRGVDRYDAIIEAGKTRLRPIVMANLTTVIALLPLAMGMGWGGEMRAPMAMVQIGGLIAGGGMGLLIVPVIYTISDDFNNWVKRILHIGS